VATIMPFFNDFPMEAQIVGRLLTGYGELELELAKCVGTATGNIDAAINAIFSKRGAELRIKLAGKLAESGYDAAGLGEVYRNAVNDMDHCRSIRNQYAHLVDLRLLERQEEFCHTVQRWFWYIAGEHDVKFNNKKGHIWLRPPSVSRPALHN
jgi:hypothetical protein